MTSVTRPEPPGPARDSVFARLISELTELGFEPAPAGWHPHEAVYTATDSGVVVTVVHDAPRPHVCVSDGRGADTGGTCTGPPPPRTRRS